MLAIVLLNWNGLEDTLECIASIARADDPNVRVIVVDNGSSGNQAEHIATAFPKVTVLPQAENLGFCGGCNVGIQYALEHGAEYVMLLNNDTLVPKDAIEKLITAAERLPDAGAVSPVILEHPATEKVWYSNARWIAEEAQFRLAYPDENYNEIRGRAPYATEFACGCCMLIPRAALENVGLLDERYFAFYDEADWCERAHRLGLRSYVVPSANIHHKVSRSTPSLVSTYLLTRNRLLWMKENLAFKIRFRSAKYLVRDFVWHVANLFGLTKKYYSRDHSRAVIRGYRDYFLGRFGKWGRSTETLIFR